MSEEIMLNNIELVLNTHGNYRLSYLNSPEAMPFIRDELTEGITEPEAERYVKLLMNRLIRDYTTDD